MTGLLIDLDGVVYQNNQLIPGAKQTLQWLRENNIPHLFVTNTSSKPLTTIVEKLANMGIQVKPESILTPPSAAAAYLQEKQLTRTMLLVASPTYEDFSQLDICTPESTSLNAVVVGDLGQEWTFYKLNQAFNVLMAQPQAELVALGMTRYWKTAQGLQLDVGPFVSALAYATGREPVIMGKPSSAFFKLACSRLGLPAEQVFMIGDDAKSDVGGAQQAGIRGVLVKTGKFQASDLQTTAPDIVLESFAELPASTWLT